MKRLMMTTLLLTCTACATSGWDHQVVTQEDATKTLAGAEATSAQRRALTEVAGVPPDEPVSTHPPICRRKECAGPQNAVHEELREAAVLLAALRQLELVQKRLEEIPEDSSAARTVRSIVQERLPELSRRIEVTRSTLIRRTADLPEFEELISAKERLDTAMRIATRLGAGNVASQSDSRVADAQAPPASPGLPLVLGRTGERVTPSNVRAAAAISPPGATRAR